PPMAPARSVTARVDAVRCRPRTALRTLPPVMHRLRACNPADLAPAAGTFTHEQASLRFPGVLRTRPAGLGLRPGLTDHAPCTPLPDRAISDRNVAPYVRPTSIRVCKVRMVRCNPRTPASATSAASRTSWVS